MEGRTINRFDTLRTADLKAYVDIAFDGKECTPVGPTVPKGLTLSLTKAGHIPLLMVEKLDGNCSGRSAS